MLILLLIFCPLHSCHIPEHSWKHVKASKTAPLKERRSDMNNVMMKPAVPDSSSPVQNICLSDQEIQGSRVYCHWLEKDGNASWDPLTDSIRIFLLICGSVIFENDSVSLKPSKRRLHRKARRHRPCPLSGGCPDTGIAAFRDRGGVGFSKRQPPAALFPEL